MRTDKISHEKNSPDKRKQIRNRSDLAGKVHLFPISTWRYFTMEKMAQPRSSTAPLIPITFGRAFLPVTSLSFEVQCEKKGVELIDNLFNVPWPDLCET